MDGFLLIREIIIHVINLSRNYLSYRCIIPSVVS